MSASASSTSHENQGPLRGCSVLITPQDDVWLVSLITDALSTVTMRTYHELPEAVDAAYEWTMLSDETEITPDAFGAVPILMETLAHNALREEMAVPANIDEVMERAKLRTWFEREMRKSRQEVE